MFTSTVPSEGKSTTSLLLALTSAQMGRSAVIVDCDLRRPTLGRFFGERLAETAGIRGVLDGSLDLDDAIFHDSVTGLHILSSRLESGTVINAADVLSSEKFGELLEELKQRFDLVILDAPPTLSVTDARIISQRVDTTLYCVRWDDTPRETVLDGLREFSLVKPNIAGIVATMVDVDKASRYGYSGYGVGSYRYYSDPYYTN
jgi:capsular exopolysaccharide synthesis family protein